MNIKMLVLVIGVAFSLPACADKDDTAASVDAASTADLCFEKAYTQGDLNLCSSISFKAADTELNRVYHLIRKVYAEDVIFLSKLKKSQLLWIKLRDADMEMMYPLENKEEYGSSFAMCALTEKTNLTLQRVLHLKKWIAGSKEGNFCSGSIQNESSILDKI